ncbi:MAG: TonB-dependent receptor [Selenomonadaceae bacterium]|nr:TonB-dependent receptor [Selenomonadaceae bacterium]
MSKKKYALLSLAVSLALAQPVYAAEDNDSGAEKKTRDIVVTASRTEQEIAETPSAVEVITSEDLERMGANTLTEALRLATDLNITQSSMGNNVSLRGMQNNQTLILINGRRVRTEDTNDSANKYELNRVNMSNVERIEIVRGAVSSLYGSEAMGGVINIITKKNDKESVTVGGDWTTHETDAYFHLSSGKRGRWTTDMDFKYVNTRNWGYLGSTADVYNYPMGTYTMNTQTTNQFGEHRFFDVDARYEVDKNREINLFFDYTKEELEALTLTEHVISWYPVRNFTVGYRNVFNHERYTAGVGYSGIDKRGDWEMRAYHTRFTKGQRMYYTYYSTGRHQPGEEKTDAADNMTFHTTTIDGKRSWQLDDKNLLTFGGEWRSEKYDSTRLGDGSSDTNYAAFYLQDEWLASKRWLLIPSVRWDYSGDFGSKVTAKLGSNYRLSPVTRFKVNVGSAYRAPTASELYMDWNHVTGGVQIQGNPDLKPETSLNYDLSLESSKGRTSGKISYFRNDVKNLIDYEPTTAGGTTYRYINVSNAKIQGVETEIKQRLGDKFSLRASYSYLDAINDDTGDRLANRPRHNAKLILAYDDSKNSGITAMLWHDWLMSYRYELGEEQGDTNLTTLNFVINKKWKNGLSAYFGVDNIFDQKDVNLFADGRVWRAGVKCTF